MLEASFILPRPTFSLFSVALVERAGSSATDGRGLAGRRTFLIFRFFFLITTALLVSVCALSSEARHDDDAEEELSCSGGTQRKLPSPLGALLDVGEISIDA